MISKFILLFSRNIFSFLIHHHGALCPSLVPCSTPTRVQGALIESPQLDLVGVQYVMLHAIVSRNHFERFVFNKFRMTVFIVFIGGLNIQSIANGKILKLNFIFE